MGEEKIDVQTEDAMAPVSLEDEIGNFLDDTPVVEDIGEVVDEQEMCPRALSLLGRKLRLWKRRLFLLLWMRLLLFGSKFLR